MRKALKINWFLPYISSWSPAAKEERSRYLDLKQDVAIITVNPPFEINESTAPACIKLSNRTIGQFDDLDGKTCYSSFYKKTASSVKLMYSPLLMMNKDKVRNQCFNKIIFLLLNLVIIVQFYHGTKFI